MKAIKSLAVALFLLTGVAGATQWYDPASLGGNTTPWGISADGGFYRSGTSSYFSWVPYLGNYTWGWSASVLCTIEGVSYVSRCDFDPNRRSGFALVGGKLCPLASPNGITWTLGPEMVAWRREYSPVCITCAWRGPQRWLYCCYADRAVRGAPYPYNNPVTVNFDSGGDGKVIDIAVRTTGDYAVITDDSGPHGRDLYEVTGTAASWGTKTYISEINQPQQNSNPILGAVESHNLILWLVPYTTLVYHTWYAKGANTSGVTPSSLGRVKVMFK